MKELLDKEQLELCRLLSLALCNKELDQLKPEVDYARVIEIAEKHKVTAFLHPVLDGKNLPEATWKVVDQRGVQVVQQSYRLLMLAHYVTQTLQDKGIDAILLKGCGTAAWYPVPELRKSGDVDLLLRNEKEARKALDILAEKGFQKEENQLAQHHIVCQSPDCIEIELHTALAEPFDNQKTNHFLENCQQEYFEHRRMVDTMGMTFLLSSDDYHAFYLLLHMLQHYLRAGFGIKLLCDWVVFWNAGISDKEKENFIRLVSESGTLGFAAMMTKVCVRYLGLDKSKVEFLLQAYDASISKKNIDLTEELMAEIFEAEEFGHSSKDRMVVVRGTGLLDYAREFHHQMKLTYPRAGKIVVLYPALWIMTLCGFLYRNRTLRKVSSRQILQKAKKRSQLVEQMKLFQ